MPRTLAAVPDLDVMELPVWPAADLWPMLPPGDVEALRADITRRGMVHPLVTYTDPAGVRWLIDGRNRRAALEGTDIDPSVVAYDGDDPDGFVLSVNLQRRHATASQLAMVAASAITARAGGDRDPSRKITESKSADVGSLAGVSPKSLSDARYLLDHKHDDFVRMVMAGAVVVSAAAKAARHRDNETKQAVKARRDEQKEQARAHVAEAEAADAEAEAAAAMTADELIAHVAELRQHAPDLMDLDEASHDVAAINGVWDEFVARRGNATTTAKNFRQQLADFTAETSTFLLVTPESLALAAAYGVHVDTEPIAAAMTRAQAVADNLRVIGADRDRTAENQAR